MPAFKTCLCAAIATGALASAMAAAPVAAQADTAHATQAANNGPETNSLAMEALRLPKVGPSQVLELAESQVGTSEDSYGGGTKFHKWYMSTPRAGQTLARDGGTLDGYANAPWCDMFVSWVGDKLGIRPVMGWDAYTVEHAKWFEDHQRWGQEPKPGAVVFFDWGGSKNVDDIDHVGFVVKDNGDGTIKTVEGNTGDGAVEVRTRSTDTVVGYGYPLYTAP